MLLGPGLQESLVAVPYLPFCLQELQIRLSDEIGKLRSFITSRCSGDRSPQNNERNSCELEVWGA